MHSDYTHKCGLTFHKNCIKRYFESLKTIPSAEQICPYCYNPIPLDFNDDVKEGTVEVSALKEEAYDQYLSISNEFSTALIDGQLQDVAVFLSSPKGNQFFVNVDFRFYPKKPIFAFPIDLIMNLEDIEDVLRMLNAWDVNDPPQLVNILKGIERRIIDKFGDVVPSSQKDHESFIADGDTETEGVESSKDVHEKVETARPLIETEIISEDLENEKTEKSDEMVETEFVREESEGSKPSLEAGVEFVEVSSSVEDDGETAAEKEESVEFIVENIYPFTDLSFDYPSEVEEDEGSFDNEDAIQQYLDLNNNFSVTLVKDRIYDLVIYITSLDKGVYNIYPITGYFKDYPKRPSITITDDLLIRLRGLNSILDYFKNWDEKAPEKIVDILQGIEAKLIEDSLLHDEFELIKREYRAAIEDRNRIDVVLDGYGFKSFKAKIDVHNYPSAPEIELPHALKIDLDSLDSIKRWEEKPQKKISDVVHNISQSINDAMRSHFEKELISLNADNVKFDENGAIVFDLKGPLDSGASGKETGVPKDTFINFKASFPSSYPISPPELDMDLEPKELMKKAEEVRTRLIKSWSPSMFLLDLVDGIYKEIFGKSIIKCLHCHADSCPECEKECGASLDKKGETCVFNCPHCHRYYHRHCVENALLKGIDVCGYCMKKIELPLEG